MNLLLTVGKSILMRKPTSHRETFQYFKLFFEGEIKKPKLEVVGEIGQIISVRKQFPILKPKYLLMLFIGNSFTIRKALHTRVFFIKKDD